MELRKVPNFTPNHQPGDYFIVDGSKVCSVCRCSEDYALHGGTSPLIEGERNPPHAFTPRGRYVMIACPKCGKWCGASAHRIVNDDPLTLEPSLRCVEDDCDAHYWVAQGHVTQPNWELVEPGHEVIR